MRSFEIMKGGVKMAVILSGRWDWWNEYTDKDRVVDCLNMLSDELGRWPTCEEVTEVWPEYTLQFIQAKFGSYDTVRAEAHDKIYRKNQGYRVKESSVKIVFTEEQERVIEEIKKRPQVEKKPTITPQPTEDVKTEIPMGRLTTTVPRESVRFESRQPKKRPGRKPTFSDAQLMGFLRQIVVANGGEVPTTARAKELLREQPGAPSLMTMTNRLGPITSWESRLENAS